MKHLEHTLEHMCIAIATCATSRSTFATSIYSTCNIPLKHLKHAIATSAFSVAFACCLDEWRLVAKLDAAEWCGGRQCGAHRRHGPWQGQGQSNGVRPRWETRVQAGSNGVSGGGAAKSGVRPGAKARDALSEQPIRARRKASE
jgi:hypothetical protein